MVTQDDAAESAQDDATPDPAVHDAARLRGPKRLLLVGPVVAFLLAFATSAAGGDGRGGMVLLLLLLAVVFAVTGLWVGALLLVDQFRGDPTSVRRSVLAATMFVATFVCMIASSGLVASSGAGT